MGDTVKDRTKGGKGHGGYFSSGNLACIIPMVCPNSLIPTDLGPKPIISFCISISLWYFVRRDLKGFIKDFGNPGPPYASYLSFSIKLYVDISFDVTFFLWEQSVAPRLS